MTLAERTKEPLRRADPRLLVLVLVLWSFLLAFLETKDAALAGLLGSSLLYLLSGPKNVFWGLKNLLTINLFLVFVWLILPFSFSYPGSIVYRLGPLAVTREGLDLSILLSLKALAITLGAMAITGASSVFDLLAGARRLGAPEKLVALLLLMTRYTQVIGEQYHRLRQAMRVRGFNPKTNFHTLRSYANLAGLLLVRGIDRAERVQAAMLCRGYTGRFWIRTDFKFQPRDFLIIFLVLCLSCLVTVIDARLPS
ncbi:MAG: cobalt ECF transporter T component CbiQ [Deltaproteobacteria bacterium]|jgi:cobalt/nickel transport system permease protein|nr:cobalt ECF transporter T component CbiQ [Deltaproteobacteria bacterium]